MLACKKVTAAGVTYHKIKAKFTEISKVKYFLVHIISQLLLERAALFVMHRHRT
jgi:hypothetical protein